MDHDQELMNGVNQFRKKLNHSLEIYQKQTENDETSWKDFGHKKENAERCLQTILNSIPDEATKKKLFENIRGISQTSSNEPPDFDKFLYYVDALSTIPYSNKIRYYNPTYCLTVVRSIAKEYVKITSALERLLAENKALSFQKNEKNRSSLVTLWGDFCANTIAEIAAKKANSIIHDVEVSAGLGSE